MNKIPELLAKIYRSLPRYHASHVGNRCCGRWYSGCAAAGIRARYAGLDHPPGYRTVSHRDGISSRGNTSRVRAGRIAEAGGKAYSDFYVLAFLVYLRSVIVIPTVYWEAKFGCCWFTLRLSPPPICLGFGTFSLVIVVSRTFRSGGVSGLGFPRNVDCRMPV